MRYPWPANETGPCGRCREPTHRYGPEGGPLCESCESPEPKVKPEPWPEPKAKGRAVPAPRLEPECEPELALF